MSRDRPFPYALPPPSADLPTLPSATTILPPPSAAIPPLHPPSDPAFPALSNALLHHPFFPLLIHRVLTLCGGAALFRPAPLAALLRPPDLSARHVAAAAAAHGIHRACARWSPTDIYLAALLHALDTLPTAAPHAAGSALQHALLAGERALAARAGAQHQQHAQPQQPRQHADAHHLPLPLKGVHSSAGSRTPLTEQAKERLEKWFLDNVEDPFPTDKEKGELGLACGMSMQSVNNWFGNKRMRIKRKLLNLPPGAEEEGAPDAASISDKVLSPRAKWKAVVVSRLRTRAGRDVVLNAMGRARSYGDVHELHAAAAPRQNHDGSVGYQ